MLFFQINNFLRKKFFSKKVYMFAKSGFLFFIYIPSVPFVLRFFNHSSFI